MEEEMYYKVKVALKVEQDSGAIKKVTEEYLVKAINVTDAEVKIIKEFEGYSDFKVTTVTETKIIKVIN